PRAVTPPRRCRRRAAACPALAGLSRGAPAPLRPLRALPPRTLFRPPGRPEGSVPTDTTRLNTAAPPRPGEQHRLTGCPATSSNGDRKSTRLNSSHVSSPYAACCLKKQTPAHAERGIRCHGGRARHRG